MARFFVSVVLALALLPGLQLGVVRAAGVAKKDTARTVERLAAEAAGSYKAGDFLRAAELLEEAYKLSPISPIIYNLAKAYDKLTEDDKALDLYKKYIVAADADPKLKQRAETRIAAINAQKANPGVVVEAKPKKGAKEPLMGEGLVSPNLSEPVEDPKVAAQRRERRNILMWRGLGFGSLGLGVALLGAGIGLGVAALGQQDSFRASIVEADKRRFRDTAKSYAIGADVMYAVGAAAVGVSAYFLYRGFRPTPSAQAMLVPLDRGGALVVGGTF